MGKRTATAAEAREAELQKRVDLHRIACAAAESRLREMSNVASTDTRTSAAEEKVLTLRNEVAQHREASAAAESKARDAMQRLGMFEMEAQSSTSKPPTWESVSATKGEVADRSHDQQLSVCDVHTLETSA